MTHYKGPQGRARSLPFRHVTVLFEPRIVYPLCVCGCGREVVPGLTLSRVCVIERFRSKPYTRIDHA